MVSERNVGEESTGLILQIAQHPEMLDALLDRLDVTVEHRAVRSNTESVRDAMYFDPILTSELLVGDVHANTLPENLRSATGQRIQTRFAKRDQNILDRHLVDARDVGDL